jgi:hypothetical protein
MKKIINTSLLFLLITILLAGCSSSVPDCNNADVKNTLLNFLKKEIMESAVHTASKFGLDSKVDMLTTINNQDKNSKSCEATVLYTFPSELDNDYLAKVTINYDVKNNEVNKGSFFIRSSNYDVTEAVKMQNSLSTLRAIYIEKMIGMKLDDSSLLQPIKDELLQKGFTEVTNIAECKDPCIRKFKNDKYLVTINTSIIKEGRRSWRTGVVNPLLGEEVLDKWFVTDAN